MSDRADECKAQSKSWCSCVYGVLMYMKIRQYPLHLGYLRKGADTDSGCKFKRNCGQLGCNAIELLHKLSTNWAIELSLPKLPVLSLNT
jgi:hypothetical protein